MKEVQKQELCRTFQLKGKSSKYLLRLQIVTGVIFVGVATKHHN